jgi:hypothetical protein
MTQIKQPPWRIVNKYDSSIESADKAIMLHILEQEALNLKNKELSKVEKEMRNYDYWNKTLTKSKKYQKALEDNFNNHKYYPAEAIIKLMPDEHKMKRRYTEFLDGCLQKIYERWNTVGSIGMTQMMLVHHPIREIKMAGLEMIIADNIGTGSAYDLTWIMCKMTNCRFIVTEYINQEYHGYRQADSYCPSHGNKLYNNESRAELKQRWNELIK